MKRFLKIGLMFAVMMLILNVFSVTEIKAQNILNEILKRMDAHQKALTSLKANVVMDKFNSQLGEHDISEGAAIYLPAKGRNALVRIDWTKPTEETLAVVDKKYVLYTPRLKRALTGNTDSAKGNANANALSFMDMSKEQLRANYTVVYMGRETLSSGVETWRLKLTPKTAQKYQFAELWVDGNGMPLQAKLVEGNGDSTTILLSNLQKNISINASQFKVILPKDVKPTKT